ncbi:MAG: ankyrin repeat domain-containing protein, partial [Endozoicomonadaceae bacterium]|nr:ankyrin repeat domain-containing protein [Endozoicomonadaceae bacterium]
MLPAFSISAFAGDLFVAVQQRNLIAINQLINEGADVNIQNEHGNTPLHEAIYNGFTKGAILLIVPDFKIFIADNNG